MSDSESDFFDAEEGSIDNTSHRKIFSLTIIILTYAQNN